MKWFRKLFKKKKKSYPQDNEFKLCIIDEKSDLLHDILGMTEVRCQEISKVVIEAYDRNDLMHESLDEILANCKHINEVVLALYVFHKYQELHNKKTAINKLFGI
jgi:hypothetical protein